MLRPLAASHEDPPCDFTKLEEFLAKESLCLPASYKEFLAECNGGRTFWGEQKVSYLAGDKRRKERELAVLYSFDPKLSYEGNPRVWKEIKRYHPRFLFPIGMDYQDGFITLIAAGKLAGKMYVLDSQKTRLKPKSTEEELFKDRGVWWLADSFDEFIDGLQICKRERRAE
ncbi:MAG: SMI1/KNR4 family protein [Verrucomicrobiota bacterium]